MDENILNSMIAHFAVLEQIVINLTHIVTSDFDRPVEVREAIVRDVRERFRTTLAGADTAASRQFAQLALRFTDAIEPRLLGDTGEASKQ
jgi:hypothetical protein